MMQIEDYFELAWAHSRGSLKKRTINLPIEDQFRCLSNIPELQNVKLAPSTMGDKSTSQSIAFRNQGNEAYKRADYRSAGDLYTKAILYAPSCGSDDSKAFPLALGNRSAALYQTGHCVECLQDIRIAIKYGYPQDKSLKLCERRAACFEALGDKAAARACREAVEKCCGTNNMLSQIEKNLADLNMKGKQNESAKQTTKSKNPWKQVPHVADSSNVQEALTSAVELKVNESRGRHYIAKRDIEPGEVILVEKPFIHYLHEEKRLSHCSNCVKRCMAPVPCRSCSLIIYCSEACEKEAWESSHRLECQINLLIDRLCNYMRVAVDGRPNSERDMPSVSGLALRTVLKAGVHALFESFSHDNNGSAKAHTTGQPSTHHSPSNFQAVFNLIRLDNVSQPLLASAFTCLKILEKTSFFDEFSWDDNNAASGSEGTASAVKSGVSDLSTSSDQVTEFKVYVAGMMYKLQQIYKLNVMAIYKSEIHSSAKGPIVASFSLASGLFVQGNFFNHSCYPNVNRCFHSTTGVFRSLRSISKGEELAISYYPSYYCLPIDTRRAHLLDFFGFVCSCQACAGKWPVAGAVPQLRCTTCKARLEAPLGPCRSCQQSPVPSLRSMASVDLRYIAAKSQMDHMNEFSAELLPCAIAYLKHLENNFEPPCQFIVDMTHTLIFVYQTQGSCYDMRGTGVE